MENKYKKTILIDLDGVLNTYDGNFDKNIIPPIKDGAKEFLKNLSETYDIKIFTTRNKILASKWILENKLDNYIQDVTDHKDLCWLFIDDRCINFQGNYEKLNEQIKNFKAWYKILIKMTLKFFNQLFHHLHTRFLRLIF